MSYLPSMSLLGSAAEFSSFCLPAVQLGSALFVWHVQQRPEIRPELQSTADQRPGIGKRPGCEFGNHLWDCV
jgi:hypothetical protein